MNELLQRIRERLAQANARLTTVQKITIGVVGLLLAGAIGTLAWMGTRTEYAVLYSDLKQDDAGRIVEKLKADKIEFMVEKSGTTIMVPAERADELRITLAADGPIDGNLGYRLLDRGDTFGMPEEILKVNRQRALEGELAKSIESLEEVKSARVHLAQAEHELFVEDQKQTTASVVVTLVPGASLRPKQVKGIVNLVAGAVSGLDPDNVTIISESGKILRPANEEQLAEMQRNVEYQRNIERELEQKATEVLERAVGRGKAVVRVRARMDFTKEQRTEELYDPKQQVARSEENLTESRQNGADRVGGVAGATPNDPNVAQGVIRVGDASNSNREKQTVNYEISKVTKQVMVPELKLSRVSVAVLVDGNNAQYRNHLAAALLTTGSIQEAIYNLQKATALVPTEPKYIVNLGYAWHRAGDEQRALVWYMRALIIDPRDDRARLFAGHALVQLGMPDEATLEFRRVLLTDPDNAAARAALTRLGKPVPMMTSPPMLEDEPSTTGAQGSTIP